jgi:GUN4-like
MSYTNSAPSKSSKPDGSKSGLLLAFLCSSLTIGSAIGLAIATTTHLPAQSQTSAKPIPMPMPMPMIISLPKSIEKKLIEQVVRDTKIPETNLRVAEIKAQDFGGCLDIYEQPSQPCTANVVRGWKAIIISSNQTFIYHLSTDASQIRHNKSASGTRPPVRVTFSLFRPIPAIDYSQVVFQSSSAGNSTKSSSRIVLTKDGKVTLHRSPLLKIKPVLLKTLSPAQVNAFQKELETQLFPNFNGVVYLTNALQNSDVITTYQGLNSFVQFIDLEKKNLPRSLQRVINRWESLIVPGGPIAQDDMNPKVLTLQQLLKAKKWKEADQETRKLLQIPTEVTNSFIQAIDRVWLKESNNRFGLSVQSKIWRESIAKYPKDSQKATDAFRDRVGWKISQPRSGDSYDFISSDWRNESELNYSDKAPIGHLPWAGVSDAEIAKLMSGVAEGCGSCTTDAMQLRNERFYGYLPQLFDRVKAAIGVS